jgi:hypothetical protein
MKNNFFFLKPCPFTADDFIELIPLLRRSDKIQCAKKLTPDLNVISEIIDKIKPLVLASTKRTLTTFQKSVTTDTTLSLSDGDADDHKSI